MLPCNLVLNWVFAYNLGFKAYISTEGKRDKQIAHKIDRKYVLRSGAACSMFYTGYYDLRLGGIDGWLDVSVPYKTKKTGCQQLGKMERSVVCFCFLKFDAI